MKDHYHSVGTCSRKFTIHRSSLKEKQNGIKDHFIEKKSIGTQTKVPASYTSSSNRKLYDRFDSLKTLNLI